MGLLTFFNHLINALCQLKSSRFTEDRRSLDRGGCCFQGSTIWGLIAVEESVNCFGRNEIHYTTALLWQVRPNCVVIRVAQKRLIDNFMEMRLLGRTLHAWDTTEDRNFIERMTSDRQLPASREGLK